MEAIITKNRLQREQTKRDTEKQDKQTKSPHHYEGTDPIMKLRSELRQAQFLTKMTDRDIERQCRELQEKLDGENNTTD